MGKREVILESALNIFNENGVVQTSTNHIAKAAKVSPGNLYYHFKNKEEIIRSLLDQHFKEIMEFSINPDDLTPSSFGKSFLHFSKSQYKYRFFYRDISLLLSADEKLRGSYLANKSAKIGDPKLLAKRFREDQFFRLNSIDMEWERFFELSFFSTDYWLIRVSAEFGFDNYSSKQYCIDIWENVKIQYGGYSTYKGMEFLNRVDYIIKKELGYYVEN